MAENSEILFVEKTVKRGLEKALVGTTEPSSGFVLAQYGRGGSMTVIACCRCTKALVDELDEVGLYFSGGVFVCGIFYCSAAPPNQDNVKKACDKLLQPDLLEKINRDKLLICHMKMNTERISTDSFYWCDSSTLVPCPAAMQWSEAQRCDSSMTFRLQATLPLAFEYTLSNKAFESLTSEFLELQDQIKSDVTAFHIDNTNIILYYEEPSESRIIPISDSASCETLYDRIETDNVSGNKKKDRLKDIVHVSLLQLVTGYQAVERTINCAPVIHQEQKDFQNISLNLPIDVLVTVDPQQSVGSLAQLLADSICKQLAAMEKAVLHFYMQDKKFLVPRPYHFRPTELGHYVTTLFPDGLSEDRLEPVRRSLNQKFSLSMEVPYFRRMNAYTFPGSKIDGYLRNTHIGLPPSGVNDATQYIVHGTYSYHHYMQDRFDDNHWGCAYRSLQTIVSWFRHQGYTDASVPSHRTIQQALVDIGDKEPSFAGSRKWIGSMEVSFCLDQLLGVQSKILFVQNGSDLVNKGRELAMHFSMQGTPIMIGGGVLAHTILGVDFNDVTGDMKFLILDPHYTGAEDLKTIQDKGWCGWKGGDFWDKTAYYNLCMPQRPKMI